jgi:hypothetical protein
MTKIFLMALCFLSFRAFASESEASLVSPEFDVQNNMKCNSKGGSVTRHKHRQQGNDVGTFRHMTDQDFDLVTHSQN